MKRAFATRPPATKTGSATGGYLFGGSQEAIDDYLGLTQLVERFTLAKTKAELLEGALERGLLIAPITTVEEVVESPQLAAREYWADAGASRAGAKLQLPGTVRQVQRLPDHLSTPTADGWRTQHRDVSRRTRLQPPAAGRAEIAGDYHMTHTDALAGVNILDFMWAIAGPASTRMLADYGATVVRLESTTRFDAVRTVGPFQDGKPGLENAGLFYNMNAGKLPVTLDLSKDAAREVILDLVRWADVVTESFSPKTMRGLGDWTMRPCARSNPTSSCSARV